MPVGYMVPRADEARPPRARESGLADADQNSERDEATAPEAERSRQGPTVSGDRAILRHGIAFAPSRAPKRIKEAIWAANTLNCKPYIWGGGHGSFSDRGYDCSGTVSYALHGAGIIGTPLASDELMRYGESGRGRWMTIYARRGHTFAVIAELRLDTTDFQDGGTIGPRWHEQMRDTRGYVARHPRGM